MKRKLSKLLTFVAVFFVWSTTLGQTTTVLNFTADAPANWLDGIVEDGEGGSADIAGVTLQIYNITNNAGTKLNSPMKWYDNSNLSSSVYSYSAITEDFDSSLGSKGIAIKAMDGKLFTLNGFTWYDWGFNDGATVTVKGYVNGLETVSTSFISNDLIGASNNPVVITFSANAINNVNEVRMTTVNSNRYPSINRISVTTNTTLPVNLVGFVAKQETNGEVLLSWKTSSEQNNKRFVVQHSIDGQNFKNIGEINSKGSTSNSYSFIHAKPERGTNYYQLLQEDLNGSIKNLGLKSVTSTFKDDVVIFPNPTKDFAEVKFLNSLITEAKILDAQGRVMKNVDIKLSDNNLLIDLRTLPSGHYFVQLMGEDAKVLKQLIKI